MLIHGACSMDDKSHSLRTTYASLSFKHFVRVISLFNQPFEVVPIIILILLMRKMRNGKLVCPKS